MKRILIGAFAIGALVTASELSAQSFKPVSLGIAAGAAIPVGDFADAYNTGFNGTVGLGLSSVGTPLGVRFEGMYNKFFGRDGIIVAKEFEHAQGTIGDVGIDAKCRGVAAWVGVASSQRSPKRRPVPILNKARGWIQHLWQIIKRQIFRP